MRRRASRPPRQSGTTTGIRSVCHTGPLSTTGRPGLEEDNIIAESEHSLIRFPASGALRTTRSQPSKRCALGCQILTALC